MKLLLKHISLCASVGVCNLLLFALLIRTSLFGNIYIYYYRILYIIVVLALLTLAVLIGLRFWAKKSEKSFWLLTPTEIFSVVVTVGACMALVASVASMPIDRSYTIYSLADMAESPEHIYSQQDVENAFIDGYIKNMGATKRRLEEQISIGNIAQVDSGYQITEKGIRQIGIFRLYERMFPVSDKRILYPDTAGLIPQRTEN